MTDTLTTDQQRTAEVARLNDLVRQRKDPKAKIHLTFALDEHLHGDSPNPRRRKATHIINSMRLARLVANAEIEPGNDPHGERDFGVVFLDETKIYWKIDAYADDGTMQWGSEAPWDPDKTIRTLTMMLPSDY